MFVLQTSPFDYLIKQHPHPRSSSPNVIAKPCAPCPWISQEPVGSADAEFFKASRVSRSGVGRVDNGRPILKVTLYVAENPGSHTISSIHRVTLPLRVPPPPLWRGDTRNPPLMQLTVSKAWPCLRPLRVDEDGRSDKRIPRRRNPRFETAISRSIGDRSRLVLEETEDHGGRGEEGPSRRWTGWKSVEITGALPFFLLTANRKRIIGRLIGYSG